MADFTHTWTTFIQPMLTPVVALIGALSASFVAWRFGSIQAGIARQQAATAATAAATARNKLKLELFERRVVIYDVIYAYIDAAALRMDTSEKFAFSQRVHPVAWLFSQEVADWVHRDLARVVRRVQSATDAAFDKTQPPSMNDQLEFTEAQQELSRQHVVLSRLFDPYLRLEH